MLLKKVNDIILNASITPIKVLKIYKNKFVYT